jgi:hypothetical protein
MFARPLFLLSLLLQSIVVDAQIEGKVIDATSGEAIPFAHVFISNTTALAVTDLNGYFYLNGITNGSGQLVVTFVGYEDFSMSLSSTRKPGKLEIALRPKKETLETVTVAATEDKEWQRGLKIFKRDFFGRTLNAKGCEILNPWVLEFEKKGNTFLADASAPLEIMNEALGYELVFHLNTFQSAAGAYSIVGPVRFRPLDDPARIEEWERRRLTAYLGSMKHFFRLLSKGDYKENGFRIYRSVNALENEQRTGKFELDLGKRVKEVTREEVVRDDAREGLILFSLKPVEIHYLEGRDFEPIYDDVLHQVSWIQASGGMVRFDSAGNILNPQDVVVSGYWNKLRVADLLPLDYMPGQSLQSDQEETIRIVTDRGVYAPESRAWYTVLVSGRSLTVDVDLIDSAGRVLASRMDPVERGMGTGSFVVPKGTSPLYLRATTPKSYSDGHAFVKPVMRDAGNFMIRDNDAGPDRQLEWRLDSLGGREMLTLSMLDTDRDTLSGNFALAITHAGSDGDCLQGEWQSFEKPRAAPVTGVPSGTITNRKGNPLSGKLVFFTSNLGYSLERNVSANGRFRLDDLINFDSTRWMVQFYDRKNRSVEDFEVRFDDIEIRTFSQLTLPSITCELEARGMAAPEKTTARKVEKAPGVDGLQLSDSTTLLSEVTVRGRRISRDARPSTSFRSYGAPQYVVKGEELAKNPVGVNLLNTLNGRVPGLIMNESVSSWTGDASSFQIRGIGTWKKKEDPLVIIDGMPVDDYSLAREMLLTIPLTDIDKVEVRTGLSPMQGMKGNGVISVFTKRSKPLETASVPKSAFIKSVTIPGYSSPPVFTLDSAAWSTLFWSPAIEFSWRPVMTDTSTFPDVVDVLITGVSQLGEFTIIRRRLNLGERRAQAGSTSN